MLAPTPAPDSRRLMTVRQAADFLAVSVETVRVWFRAGTLTGCKVGRSIRLHADVVHAMLKGGAA